MEKEDKGRSTTGVKAGRGAGRMGRALEQQEAEARGVQGSAGRWGPGSGNQS